MPASPTRDRRPRLPSAALALLLFAPTLACSLPGPDSGPSPLASPTVGSTAGPAPGSTVEPTEAPPGEPAIELGKTVRRDLAPGETHAYRLDLDQGDYFFLSLESSEIDVAGSLLGPAGDRVAEMNGPGGIGAAEVLSMLAPAAGAYRLIVRRIDAGSAPGRYLGTLEKRRPAVSGDERRVAAEMALWGALQIANLGTPEARSEALRRLEETLGAWGSLGDPAGEATCLNNMGRLYRQMGETGQAIDRYSRALPLWRAAGDRLGEANTLNNLGVAYQNLSQKRRSIEYFEPALAIWSALEDPANRARTLINMADSYRELGELDRAFDLYEQALASGEAARDLKVQAQALVGQAVVHNSRGELDRALATSTRAADLARTAGSAEVEGWALHEICAAHNQRGEIQQALEACSRQLDLRLSALPEAAVRDLLGAIYHDSGDLEHAFEHYGRALELFRGIGDRSKEGDIVRNLGAVYFKRGDLAAALERFGEALALARETKDAGREGLARHWIGRTHLAQGRAPEALAELEQALALERGANDISSQGDTLLELGTAYGRLGQADRARASFRQAMDLADRFQDEIRRAAIFARQAVLEREAGDLPAALADSRRAVALLERLRGNVASQGLRTSFFAARRSYYEMTVDLSMRLARLGQPGGPPGARGPESREHEADAFAASEAARARSLLDLLAEGRIDVARGLSPELERREQEIERRLAANQTVLLAALRAGQPDEARLAELRARRKEAEDDLERLEWDVRRENPRYAEVRYPKPLGLAEIRGRLDGDTALLEYMLGSEASWLFVVTREGMQAHELPPGEEIAREVEKVRRSIVDRRLQGTYLEGARELYDLLVAPAAEVLRGKPALLISPDGELYSLPFEALLTGPPPASGRYADLPYLLLRHEISYVPSASVLAGLAEPRPEPAGERIELLAFADPAYGDAAAPLPESWTEVSGIAGLFPPGTARLFRGAEASEGKLKGDPALLAGARRIHFATHGYLGEDRPQLMGLRLAQDPGDRPGHRDDGLLQAYEIFNLELHADLVVLSACDTGLGSRATGEGVSGMARAFFYAGAPSVVVSLWEVADRSTAALMVDFYRELGADGDKAGALRRAKRRAIAANARPYSWAPFILMGKAR